MRIPAQSYSYNALLQKPGPGASPPRRSGPDFSHHLKRGTAQGEPPAHGFAGQAQPDATRPKKEESPPREQGRTEAEVGSSTVLLEPRFERSFESSEPARAEGMVRGAGLPIPASTEPPPLSTLATLQFANGVAVRIEVNGTVGNHEVKLESEDEGLTPILGRVRARLRARGYACQGASDEGQTSHAGRD